MEYRILGPLELVDDDGQVVVLAGANRRALLTLLLLHANQIVSSDWLMYQLWGDQPPESGMTALQVNLSRLRNDLGPAARTLRLERPATGCGSSLRSSICLGLRRSSRKLRHWSWNGRQ